MILIIGLVNTLGLDRFAALIADGRRRWRRSHVSRRSWGSRAAAGAAHPNAVKSLQGSRTNCRCRRARGESADPVGGKMLMTKIQLELDSEESRAEVEGSAWFYTVPLTRLLSEQKSSDCIGQKQMETLRKSMLRRANSSVE